MLPLQMPPKETHEHNRTLANETWHFLICAGGILACYFVFGIQQERIVQGKYKLPDESVEKFTFTQALVFFLCTGNTIYAYLLRRKTEVDTVPTK
uniref:Uncharacterized protein n=2 Tax=Caenorhabditis japonica TaxID=281687 RepID=A0A8R1IRJ3_CAEJA